jgi:hypothetical protein
MTTLQIQKVLVASQGHSEVPDLPLDLPNPVTTFE